jgi:hypothetical protein
VSTQLEPIKEELVDRRGCYRARLANSLLRVRAWRIAPGTPLSHTPMPSQEVRFTVQNIALGGLGISLAPIPNSQPPLTSSDRLRLELVYDQINVLVEGRIRAPDAGQKGPFDRTGIRFDGNQSNHGYHKAVFWLSKIMGYVQREELKARRMAEEQAKLASDTAPIA